MSLRGEDTFEKQRRNYYGEAEDQTTPPDIDPVIEPFAMKKEEQDILFETLSPEQVKSNLEKGYTNWFDDPPDALADHSPDVNYTAELLEGIEESITYPFIVALPCLRVYQTDDPLQRLKLSKLFTELTDHINQFIEENGWLISDNKAQLNELQSVVRQIKNAGEKVDKAYLK